MDIWNMAHVEDGDKYYIRKEYTEVSRLGKGEEKQQIIIQQMPQESGKGQQAGEPAGDGQTQETQTVPTQDGSGQKEGVKDAD